MQSIPSFISDESVNKSYYSALITFLLLLFIPFVSLAQEDTTATADAATAAAGGDFDQELVSQGEQLFKANCTVCHAVHEVVVGPALAGVSERRSEEWLYSFIRNSQKMIQAGDEQAVALWNEYNQTVMPNHTFLSDNELASLLEYIDYETAQGPADQQVAQTGTGTDGTVAQTTGVGIDSTYLIAILVGLLVILVLILVVLVLIINVLTKFLRQDESRLEDEDKKVLDQKFDVGKLVKNPTFIWIAVFIFTAVVVKEVIDGLYTVGVQQGYQPEQPINFSHELHAGQYEIDCQYCHTGVRKSKSANIPSANICMNCHTEVKTESAEIQKIYEALDYDPSTRSYGPDQKPIEWVRIHNLPDLAYFNHQQHVLVGELECQECHGPIEEMPVVYQHSPLTMGWCISCHREQEVDGQDNGYYDKLLEYHADMDMDQEKADIVLKVQDIGGLECSKCHY